MRAGGATTVELRPDDRLTVRDLDGGQRAELTVAGDDYGALELAGREELFGPASPAGAEETFRAVRAAVRHGDGACRRASSSRAVFPRRICSSRFARATPREELEPTLPEPLAEPRLDFEVARASALAYEVRAGEYIQVIDVQGRQCSDFLAFHSGKLQGGQERGLDATTTRSLMGNAYPQPGLFGKFYDQDQEPLVEVVRDTVGRHDTFALACNAKYYEDLGYFGHINCSDNFNGQLLPYTIAPRKGWPALNFFFNTSFDAHNLLVSDEPWSRPGDYVLLRAMTDLVCLSSACPDDVDPANAWNPTEVHVRVYPAKERFSTAIAHRVTPDAEPKLTKDTGFRPRTGALTSRFTEYNGFWLPTAYDNHGAVDEYWACRERAAIMDLSPLRKWEVLGPDAEELLQATMTRDIRRLADGQVVYTAVCNDTGGMIDDGTVFRLHATNFRFVGGSEYDGVWLREQAERLGLRVWIKESTDELHNVAVQGPASRDLLDAVDLDRADADAVRRAQVVPLRGRAARRAAGSAADRLAHRVFRRARVRAVLPPEGRAGAVGRGDGRRRCDAARPRGARHAAHRGRSRVRRQRVRRPGRPVRGGHRLHRPEEQGGRLRRQGGARGAARASAARARRARARGQRAVGRTASACTSAASRSAWSRAGRARRS